MGVQERFRTNLGRIYGQRTDVLLDSMLSSMATIVDEGHADVDRALSQLKLQTSAAPWLDLWGDEFKIPRRDKTESDAAYAVRIIEETLRQRPQRQALEQIVLKTLGITIVIQDLLPFMLLSDQWTTPVGRPPQVCDGHLAAGWVPGSLTDQAVRCDMAYPYVPGAFGIWVDIEPENILSYTLEEIKTLLPLILISDAHLDPAIDETLHVSDRHLVDIATARTSFGVGNEGLPASILDILALIEKHRAAGTEAVFMGFVMN